MILNILEYFRMSKVPELRTFDKQDIEDIQLYLKDNAFDWKDLLSEEEYQVASMKKYFSEIAKNNVWYVFELFFVFQNNHI